MYECDNNMHDMTTDRRIQRAKEPKSPLYVDIDSESNTNLGYKELSIKLLLKSYNHLLSYLMIICLSFKLKFVLPEALPIQ
jgi:hypothetical protein